ncbi:MAG: hypothetical protein R3A11_08990 [Bdellovibrionota bacterium]
MKNVIQKTSLLMGVAAMLGACATTLNSQNKRDASFGYLKDSQSLDTSGAQCPNGYMYLKLTDKRVDDTNGNFLEGAAILVTEAAPKELKWIDVVDPSVKGVEDFQKSMGQLKSSSSPSSIFVVLGNQKIAQAQQNGSKKEMISMIVGDQEQEPIANDKPLALAYSTKNKLHLAIGQEITSIPVPAEPSAELDPQELDSKLGLVTSLGLTLGGQSASVAVPASPLSESGSYENLSGTRGETVEIPVGKHTGTTQVTIFDQKPDGHSVYTSFFGQASGGKVKVPLANMDGSPLAAGVYHVRVHNIMESKISGVTVGKANDATLCVLTGSGVERSITVGEAEDKK